MSIPVEKLRKILRLEAERHEDRAVLGGLARFADTWRAEAQGTFGPEAAAWVAAVDERLRRYSQLATPAERAPALRELLALLDQEPAAPARAPAAAPPKTPPPARPPAPPPATPPTDEPPGLSAPLTAVRGIGPSQAKRLARLGLHTIRDFLFFLPRRYDDFSTLKPINRLDYGEEVTVIARVWDAGARQTRGGASVFTATLSDETGFIEVVWFNQPYLAQRIKPGMMIVVSGRVDEYMGRLQLASPEWEPLQQEQLHTGRLVPIYALTEGVNGRWLRQTIKRAVDYWAPRLPDPLPPSVREAHQLLDLATALRQAHFPDSPEKLAAARRRLAFDELFIFQIALLRQRHIWRSAPGRPLPIDDQALQSFVLSLPFALTGAQQRALGHIVADLRAPYPMNRLLQGDVGSGKTAVAAAAMALVVAAGAQATMMAPTEILAGQHYETLNRLFAAWPVRPPVVRLLTGGVSGAEREAIYQGLADGSVDIVVGTHAVIQKGVTFRDLALAVIDEQHRFGVRQRAALRQKGQEPTTGQPHLLVMTATPIPRSLQLTLWGHLDVSIIDEMPPGRQPVTTRVILPRERERAYAFVRSQVQKGRQAFIICPLVEESEKIEAKAAVEEHQRLQKVIFPDLRLGLLHGRMKAGEKEAVMAAFVRGEMDILVATAVVEVGIDVPNATVMLIEGAERFGLAQLHQFRGRVGRGEHPSYCLLVADSASPEAEKRLRAVEATSDGFDLAQKDLEMRGPGEFLGTRQAGLLDLKIASLADLQLLETVQQAARRYFESDPQLDSPESRLLARQVAEMWKEKGEVS